MSATTLRLVFTLIIFTVSAIAESAPRLSLEDRHEVERIVEYFNSIHSIRAEFTQFDGDGVVSEGKFYLLKPRYLRFDYSPPQRITIIINKNKVALIDYELKQVSFDYLEDVFSRIFFEPKLIFSDRIKTLTLERDSRYLRLGLKTNEDAAITRLIFVRAPLALAAIEVPDYNQRAVLLEFSNLMINVPLAADWFSVTKHRP